MSKKNLISDLLRPQKKTYLSVQQYFHPLAAKMSTQVLRGGLTPTYAQQPCSKNSKMSILAASGPLRLKKRVLPDRDRVFFLGKTSEIDVTEAENDFSVPKKSCQAYFFGL